MSSTLKTDFLYGAGSIFIDSHPLPTWIVDTGSFQIRFANKAAVTLYGYSAAALPAGSFLNLFTEESRIVFFQNAAQAETAISGCFQQRKENGELLFVELQASMVVLNNEKFWQIAATDITDKISVQHQLQEESKRYKTYIEESVLGIYCQELKVPVSIHLSTDELINHLQNDGYISECNKAMAEMYGYKSPAELIGQLPNQLLDFNDPNNIAFFKDFITCGFKVVNAESHEKDKWGHSKYFLNNAIGIVEDGYLKRIWGSQKDVTERKKIESDLIESERRFRDVADSAPVMIWMANSQNVITYVNKPWTHFTGLTAEALAGKTWASIVHPDDAGHAIKKFNESFEQQQPITLVYRLKMRSGAYRWVLDTGIPRKLDDGTFVGFIGSIVDINDQKIREDQLRYQANVLENVSDIVVTSDLNCIVKSWNKAAEDFYGITEQQAIGKPVTELIQLDYQSTTREQAVAQLYETGIWQGEAAYQQKNGEVKYVSNTLSLLVNDKEEKTGVLTVGRDITDRKKAEQKLQQSEAFYRALIADSLDGIILMDAQGKISFCSPCIKKVLGYEPEEGIGRSGFEFVHPEDLAWAFTSFQNELNRSAEVKLITVRLLKKNGEWIWCRVRGNNLLNNPNVNSIVIYFHDDTPRKQATEALKESEKRFRTLIRDLQVGVFLSDKNGVISMCNKALSSMLAISEEIIVGKNVYDILSDDMMNEKGELIPRNQRPLTLTIQSKKTVKGSVIGVLHPITKERYWIMVNADPILDEQGEIQHVVCSVMDITERKKLEQKLVAEQISHQKQVTQAAIDGQEAERQTIGKDLHDNIGQQLTTIKLFLDLAKSTADETTMEMISMALKGVSDVINEIRSMSRSLVPHTLKDLGLTDSVGELIDSVSRAQLVEIDFDATGFEDDSLAENQKLTLFRIIQEQLNNITKHAQANAISIVLKNQAENVVLQIKDDGRGFDPQTVRKGLGITNIRNRAELFGGHAEIFSRPGQGCRLQVVIPVSLSPTVTDLYQ